MSIQNDVFKHEGEAELFIPVLWVKQRYFPHTLESGDKVFSLDKT
jgi:hypothetical protein